MRPPWFLALLVLTPLLAGCAALDSAREGASQVQEGLDEARSQLQEAQAQVAEAKARYERVSSLTAVRTERVDLVVEPVYDEETRELSFVPNATRSGIAIPVENLTQLPPLQAVLGEATFACDPLTCRIVLPEGGSVRVAWDAAPEQAWRVGAAGVAAYCTTECVSPAPAEHARIRLENAPVLATTSVGDATS